MKIHPQNSKSRLARGPQPPIPNKVLAYLARQDAGILHPEEVVLPENVPEYEAPAQSEAFEMRWPPGAVMNEDFVARNRPDSYFSAESRRNGTYADTIANRREYQRRRRIRKAKMLNLATWAILTLGAFLTGYAVAHSLGASLL